MKPINYFFLSTLSFVLFVISCTDRQIIASTAVAVDADSVRTLLSRSDAYRTAGQYDSCRITFHHACAIATQLCDKELMEEVLWRIDSVTAYGYTNADYEKKLLSATFMYHQAVKQIQDEELQLRQEQQRNLWLVILTSVLAIILIVSGYYTYFARKRRQLKERLIRIRQLQERLRQQRTPAACSKAHTAITTSSTYNIIREKIKNDRPLNTEEWQMMEQLMDTAYPDFRKQLSSLIRQNEHEQHVSLLIKAGITPNDIAVLTAHSKASISNTRSRLYKKVFGRNGAPKDWDDFIKTL